MLRKVMASLAFGIVTVAVGHAAVLNPGGTVTPTLIAYPSVPPGTLELFTGDTISSGTSFMATYTLAIIADPSNALCANCLDFIYDLQNVPIGSTTTLNTFATGNYNSVATDVFYASGGNVAPTSVSRSSNGGTISFLLGPPGVAAGQFSDFLIIETNVTDHSYAAGFTTITDSSNASATGIGATAISPEPASFVLLGSGLLGLAGAAKRKFAKA